MRATHTTSDIGKVRSRCSALRDLSSMLLLVLRLSSLTITSSFLVLTTTRSPRRPAPAPRPPRAPRHPARAPAAGWAPFTAAREGGAPGGGGGGGGGGAE